MTIHFWDAACRIWSRSARLKVWKYGPVTSVLPKDQSKEPKSFNMCSQLHLEFIWHHLKYQISNQGLILISLKQSRLPRVTHLSRWHLLDLFYNFKNSIFFYHLTRGQITYEAILMQTIQIQFCKSVNLNKCKNERDKLKHLNVEKEHGKNFGRFRQ